MFPIQNFTKWESSHRFVLFFFLGLLFVLFPLKISLSGKVPTILSFFFLSPFPTRFFIPFSFLIILFFFLDKLLFPLLYSLPTLHPYHFFTLSHHQPLLPALPPLATADPPIYKLFPLQPPPTASIIPFSLFFGVQVSLKCKSLCFSLRVCFDLVLF